MEPSNPRSRGLSEHGAFSCEKCGLPAHMQGWRYPQEEDFGKKCQRWVVTRDSASCCEHDDCNIAVFKRTLLSSFTPNREKNHLFGRKIRMVQPDSLNVGTSTSSVVTRCTGPNAATARNVGACQGSPGVILATQYSVSAKT